MATTTASPASPRRFLPELWAVHSEELAYLWGRRRSSLSSDALTVRNLDQLNERIEAHCQGLLVARDALVEMVEPRLADGDRDAVFAAAYPLLRSGIVTDARVVLAAFSLASGASLAGMRDALAMANIDSVEAGLRSHFDGPEAERATAAAAILAAHRRLDPSSPRMTALLTHPEPSIAQLAWAVAGMLEETSATPYPYADAIRGDDPDVRSAALGAAIWRGEAWAPGVAKRLAEDGDKGGLQWMAATAGPEALSFLQAINAPGRRTPATLRLAGRNGNPQMLESILDSMSSEDPALAVAAGDAFTRITGLAVEGRREPLPVTKEADEFEREFAPEAWLPDAKEGRRLWGVHRDAWYAGSRWCRGCEVSDRLRVDARQRIDLEALWDFGARAAMLGQRAFSPLVFL
jgi:uncharacterized protein (TIGR02270 family)